MLSLVDTPLPYRVLVPKPGKDGWVGMLRDIRAISDQNDLTMALSVRSNGILLSFADQGDAAVFRLLWPHDSY